MIHRPNFRVPVELGAVVCPSGETRFYGRFEFSPEDGERLTSLPHAAFAAGVLVGAAVALHYAATEGEAGGEDDTQDENLREERFEAES